MNQQSFRRHRRGRSRAAARYRPVWDVNLRHPVVDHGHGGLHQMHGILFIEAGQDAFGEVRVRYGACSVSFGCSGVLSKQPKFTFELLMHLVTAALTIRLLEWMKRLASIEFLWLRMRICNVNKPLEYSISRFAAWFRRIGRRMSITLAAGDLFRPSRPSAVRFMAWKRLWRKAVRANSSRHSFYAGRRAIICGS